MLALTTRRWPTREEVMEAIFGFVRCRRCVAEVREDVSEIDVDDERPARLRVEASSSHWLTPYPV